MSKLITTNNTNPVAKRNILDVGLGDFMDGFFNSLDYNSFKVDIMDKDDHYEVDADLPGYKKDELDVNIENDFLTISAKKEEETSEKSDKDENYVMHERKTGYVSRSFAVSNIKKDKVTAEYKDGVLKIVLPKDQEKEKASSKIKIK